MGQSRRTRALGLIGALAAVVIPLTTLSGRPASASPGNWTLTDCRIGQTGSGPVLNAKWHIHNLDPVNSHGYHLEVVWGEPGERLGRTSADYASSEVGSGERRTFDISTNATSDTASKLPSGPVACEMTFLRDDNNEVVKPVPE